MKQQGLTVLELMVVLAIASVLAMIAIPNFTEFVAANRRTSQTNTILATFRFARFQSIQRNQYVSVCKSNNGIQCNDKLHWEDGWIVFVNKDHDYPAMRDSNETLLAVHNRIGTMRLRANRNAFTFRPMGLRSTNGTLLVCDTRHPGNGSAIVVSYTGKSRITVESALSAPPDCSS